MYVSAAAPPLRYKISHVAVLFVHMCNAGSRMQEVVGSFQPKRGGEKPGFIYGKNKNLNKKERKKRNRGGSGKPEATLFGLQVR